MSGTPLNQWVQGSLDCPSRTGESLVDHLHMVVGERKNPQMGVFLVGFALAPIFAGLVSSTSQRVGQRHAANTIGIQFSAAGFGGAILPSLAGFLARRVSLETIPAILAASLLGLLILYLISMGVKKLSS